MLTRWKSKDKSSSKNSGGDNSKKKRKFGKEEEEWNADGKNHHSNELGVSGKEISEGLTEHSGRRISGTIIVTSSGTLIGTQSRSHTAVSGRSRDELRRHTLSGDQESPARLHHQQFNTTETGQLIHPLHSRHFSSFHSQYKPISRHNTMDLESSLPRGYSFSSSAMLFDDDPGIMSEVETSSTGFRRGGKQRSSLPVVRTPSKTLERPLGLVFLQYRSETKRALLPNEITSIDTVKALFVRSFPKQLTMEYLDSPHVKIYIHDSNKDMFYELEDLRSHLRDIRDRSVLRLFESDGTSGTSANHGIPGGTILPVHWEDQSYFSEPEFDSEFQHQHIHKSKSSKNTNMGSSYYISDNSTLPISESLLRPYSPATSIPTGPPNASVSSGQTKPLKASDRLHGESDYLSSPERSSIGGVVSTAVNSSCGSTILNSTTSNRFPVGTFSSGSSYEDPYCSQYSGTVTPVIDEEASSDMELLEESYNLYGVKPSERPPSGPLRSSFTTNGATPLPNRQPHDATRIRVEYMERQLANLTGLVQKALTQTPCSNPSSRDYLQVPATRDLYIRSTDDSYSRTDMKPPKLGKDKSVSFEKSVSFSDEPPDLNSPKQHSPQHTADSKPAKPAIKSSTLPRTSSQEKERHKPTPPPKPVVLATGQYVYRDLTLTPEMYNQLRSLQKKAKDLRQEFKNLRRMSQAQSHSVRETIRDAYITIRTMLLSSGDDSWATGNAEKLRLSREEDLYKQEILWLEKDLTGLETTVEELRGNVINRKTRVNMSDVENMALILNKASKTVADLKLRFPNLQQGMKGLLSSEMEKVMRDEKFLKEEPDRLESALKRCKKLTGTLVTLKRLASVQEQRLPNSGSIDGDETTSITTTSGQNTKASTPVPTERDVMDAAFISGGSNEFAKQSFCLSSHTQRSENALDALLDELQTFNQPVSENSQISSNSASTKMVQQSHRQITITSRAPNIAKIGRKSSIDSSCLSLLQLNQPGTLRRLHSYPSSSDTDTSPPAGEKQFVSECENQITSFQMLSKPPLPERNIEPLQLTNKRRIPPPPPPRTSSKSPLASPTSPLLRSRNARTSDISVNSTQHLNGSRNNSLTDQPRLLKINSENGHNKYSNKKKEFLIEQLTTTVVQNNVFPMSNSSSCESVNSQEGLETKEECQEQLEQRHQELLRKQKALQEQYARLQQLQRNTASCTANVPLTPTDPLKKTGSESNLLVKIGFGLSATNSGSLTNLGNVNLNKAVTSLSLPRNSRTNSRSGPEKKNAQIIHKTLSNLVTINKVYQTDIL